MIVTGCTSSVRDNPVNAVSSCVSPGVTPNKIQIGLITPAIGLSGPAYLTYRGGVDSRIGVENARGGVGGRRISYEWRDDESDPEINLAVARELVRDGVFGIIQGSTASAGSADYLYQQGVPVTGTATDPKWSEHSNMVSYSNLFSAGQSITTWGDFVREKGGTRAAVLSIRAMPSSLRLAEALRASLTARGVEVPVFNQISPIEPNLGSLVAKMIHNHVDTIVAPLDDNLLPDVVAKARGAGLEPRVVLSSSTYDANLLRTPYGHTLAGSYSFLTVQPFEARLPAHKSFLTAMEMYAPQIQPSAQQIALTGWIAADMFIRALSATSGCPTRDAALNGLHSIRNYDADGLLLRPVSLAATPKQPDVCFVFVKINDDGSTLTPLDPRPRCGEVLKS
jgi:ABC-type branched-subunit amino acid transport system substrate-binding protein